MQITVIALGKIGLPLAVQFASNGHTVIGADVNEEVVAQVNAGHEPFPGEDHLAEKLRDVVDRGLLTATTDTAEAVRGSEAVVVVVPLFVDGEGQPDFRSMDSATVDIARGLQPGTLVSYETTLPVGTTRTRFQPMLEASGLVCGTDLYVVFSPERVLTGRVFADLRKYPKLVGGLDEASAKRGVAFYESVLDFDERPDLSRPNGVWDLGSAEASELAKLAETTYRDVNIALANQFALFAGQHGIDVHAVIDASNSQPYSHIHRPGIAVGGHCIPVYPRLYLWNDPAATVVRSAREQNAAMPQRAVEMLVAEMGSLSGRRVAVLGAAYRGGVKETAFSGAFAVVQALRSHSADVFVHDPLFSDEELVTLGLAPYHLGDPVDAAIVQADHAEYARLTPDDLPGIVVLLDGRQVTDASHWTDVVRIVIGAPTRRPPAKTPVRTDPLCPE
ncbi:MAG: nucleotide sugar dehydrogenase [Dermatophilaceae bacterium]